MLVAIIDYQSGNLHSAAKAFERAARESGKPADIVEKMDVGRLRKYYEEVVLLEIEPYRY